MITTAQVKDVLAKPLVSSTGDKLGEVGQIYYDDVDHQPVFATVSTGMLMKKEHAVPLAEATLSGRELTVPYDKDMIKHAPEIDTEAGHISEAEAEELYRYYGLTASGSEPIGADPTGSLAGAPTGRHAAGGMAEGGMAEGGMAEGGMAEGGMTRSEERLDVGTQSVETGRVRLRKYVVTETVTQEVPVSREEVRLVREPASPGDRDLGIGTADFGEQEQEIVLHEERPVVQKTTVPVERVRLETDTVQDTEQVSGQVRKEQIQVDEAGDAEGRPLR